MVCEILLALQGRVDAARLFGDRLEQIIFKLGGTRSTWNPVHFSPPLTVHFLPPLIVHFLPPIEVEHGTCKMSPSASTSLENSEWCARVRKHARAWQGLRRRLSSLPRTATIVLNDDLFGRYRITDKIHP